MAAIAGICGGRSNADFLDGIPDFAAGFPLKDADHILGNLVLHFEIIFLRHISPVIRHEHGCEIHHAGAFRGALRIGIVQAYGGLNMVCGNPLHQIILLYRIGGIINEIVVAGNSQLFRRTVQPQKQGEATTGKFTAVGGSDHLLGDRLFLQHLSKHQMRRTVCDDMMDLNDFAVCKLHTGDGSLLIRQNFLRF